MWTVVDSPLGQLRIAERDGALTEIEFMPWRTTLPDSERTQASPALIEAERQLAAYFSGELIEFDLPLAPAGTEFQQQVWAQLQEIKYGQTASYGEIAGRLGLTNAASRAVGLANGRNPVPILIPCHRVVGADGKLTGYSGGIERKQFLLELETEGLF